MILRNTRWQILMFLAGLALLMALPACMYQYPVTYGSGVIPPTFSSNGQRIYFTASSVSGDPIISQGFTMMGRGFACVDCHGPQGHGGSVYVMMRHFDVPDITWPKLTGQDMDHPPYTDDGVKKAITQGVDPAGKALDTFMPRWQMSDRDTTDLISFLKTLQ